MKARELRIGNLVWHIGLGNAEISELRAEGITLCNPLDRKSCIFESNGNLHRIEPYTINEDWLLKFGFEKDVDYFSKGHIHFYLPEFSFYSGNDHVSGGNPDAKIFFVHQLQNLYFALTGKELELKQ